VMSSRQVGVDFRVLPRTTVSYGKAPYAVEGLAPIGSENFNASLATFAVHYAF
jgi:hypothetical protein